MPTNYTSRVVTILLVCWIALSMVFPAVPGSVFWLIKPTTKISAAPNLKPGIDMVGGTSLLYEIKPPEGGIPPGTNLAEKVMAALRKRVDPDGVRNIVWRPQGQTRLEIQMPLSRGSEQNQSIRKAYADAQRAIESSNVRLGQVTDAVQKMNGDKRADRLKDLAGDSAKRATVFGAMRSTWDQINDARAVGDAAKQAQLENAYEALKTQVESTNISVAQIESILAQPQAKRDADLKTLTDGLADSPSKQKAVGEFAKAYDDYGKIKTTLDDAGDLKRLLKGSGVLEFHILADDAPQSDVTAMTERLNKSGPRQQANDSMKWVVVDKVDQFRRQTWTYNDKHYALVYTTPDKQLVNGPGLPKWVLEDARGQSDPSHGNTVNFMFDVQGGRLFSDLTRNNRNKQLAIVLDDKLISAATINTEIGRSGQITGGGAGGFSQDELNYLVNTLDAGSLPATLAEEPISEQSVGPQLGADNLRAGLFSCLIGLAVVIVFMVFYYHLAGVVASIAVTMNLLIILGVMAMLGATFTLPGVAGIVLTVGAAVDANVLIFERLREEQQRGLSLKMALRNAYDRAAGAIVDSNATTVITSLVLYWLGSEEVKGFGITLLIGLISSLFTALFVTKTIFGILIDKFGVENLGSFPLSFPKWDKFLKPNIDWMGKAWMFMLLSGAICAAGLIAFVQKSKSGEMLDIEFASGTSVEFALKQPMPREEVEKLLKGDAQFEKKLPSPSVVAVQSPGQPMGSGYSVLTPNPNANEVREAVLGILGDRLKLDRPSSFDLAQGAGDFDASFKAAMNTAVVPITDDTTELGGFVPQRLGDFRGGAAVVLNNITPKLSATELRERIERQRLQNTAGASSHYVPFTVETDAAPDQAVSSAIVMTIDPAIPYGVDQLRWQNEVAAPLWQLVNDGVNKPAQLSKVINFNPSIAGDTQRDALMALTISCVIIMAYIWLRFGNFTYGTATLLAMLHDTALVIAAIGLSHWLAGTAIGNALLLEPFRINLTLVASILTIMSYSMIDTIVVFDRIRENRGKFGHVDRKVVNDSINQTLSRTILTAGTTCITVLVMYISGGPGIHGFTFVLLFGIITGTYSSIAVAAPFLLLVGKRETESKNRPVGTLQRA